MKSALKAVSGKGQGAGSKSPKAKTLKEIEEEFEKKGNKYDLEDGGGAEAGASGRRGSHASEMTATTEGGVSHGSGDGLKEPPWKTEEASGGRKRH